MTSLLPYWTLVDPKTIESLSNNDGDVNENGKKAIGVDWQNNNFLCRQD